MNISSRGACAALWVGLLLGASASAWSDSTRVVAGSHRGYTLDARYNHDQYYPPRGYVVRALPPAPYAVRWHGTPYYFHEGVWYRPERSHFVVVTAPVGVLVPALPPLHTTIWVSGEPWFYADDTYYAWRPAEHAYAVVPPPAEETLVSTMPPSGEVYAYPRDGQSPEQEASDRNECDQWATDQTGFDPARLDDGVPADEIGVKRGEYRRALSACLDGRGYSVS